MENIFSSKFSRFKLTQDARVVCIVFRATLSSHYTSNTQNPLQVYLELESIVVSPSPTKETIGVYLSV